MCECCEEIEFWKEDDKVRDIKIRMEVKTPRSTLTTQSFDLNYCPMCR